MYTGYTNDLGARIEKHKSGEGAKYTKSRGVKKLVYFEDFESKSDAMKREAEIKSWPREEKLKLISK